MVESLDCLSLSGTLCRVVESQEQVATTLLCDGDLSRQDALERLLEASKPSRREGTERLDYLLATPWRYPPLRYGSRFGDRDEPSLFYGSRAIGTALAETAYYRFILRDDTADPVDRLTSQHTSFTARYRARCGVRVHDSALADVASALSDPLGYSDAQTFGSFVRTAGFDVIEFPSARDPACGINVALLAPDALLSNRHREPREWLCTTSATEVAFSSRGQPSVKLRYERSVFEINGELPRPT